jgi:hypothetical protein
MSASLPLVLADRDSAHYLLPALSLFAAGFGLLGSSCGGRANLQAEPSAGWHRWSGC